MKELFSQLCLVSFFFYFQFSPGRRFSNLNCIFVTRGSYFHLPFTTSARRPTAYCSKRIQRIHMFLTRVSSTQCMLCSSLTSACMERRRRQKRCENNEKTFHSVGSLGASESRHVTAKKKKERTCLYWAILIEDVNRVKSVLFAFYLKTKTLPSPFSP